MAESVIENPPPRSKRTQQAPAIICEFCECKVSIRGRVLWKSEKAKQILALDEDVDRLRSRVETLEAENGALKEQVKAAGEKPTAPATATRKRAWSVGDDES